MTLESPVYLTHALTVCLELVPPPRQGSEIPEEGEEPEAMDATNADDEAMMAMMGLQGFGTTKVSHALYMKHLSWSITFNFLV